MVDLSGLMPSFGFGGDVSSNVPLTPEALAMRQKIALAMASQRSRGFPKNVGEGLTAIGEAIGQRNYMNQLIAQEQAAARYEYARRKGILPGAAAGVSNAAGAVANPAAATPGATTAPPAAVAPQASAADDETDNGRDNVALALNDTAPEVPSANPTSPGPQAPDSLLSDEAGGQQPDAPVQVASLDPSIGVNAVAPAEAANNPAIPTDIRPAPTQVAENGQLQYGGAGAPDVLAPRPTTDAPTVGGRVPLPPFKEPGGPETPPPPTEMSTLEKRAWQLMADPWVSQATRDQAKSVIAYEAAQRKMLDDRLMSVYNAKQKVWETIKPKAEEAKLNAPKIEIEQKTAEQKYADAKEADRIRQLTGGTDLATVQAPMKATYENVKDLPNTVQAIAQARKLIEDNKVFTGKTANLDAELARLVQATGFAGADPRLTGTEQFTALMKSALGHARQSLVGGAARNFQELVLAQQASGGDPTLQKQAILNILAHSQQALRETAIEHQNNVLTATLGDAKIAQNLHGYNVRPDVLESLATPNEIADLMKNKNSAEARAAFDKAWGTTGLAGKIIEHQQQVHSDDKARQWLQDHPNDPRAEAVRRRLGVP